MAAGWPTKVTYANGDVFSASDINDTNGTLNYIDPTSATDGQVLTRDNASGGKVKWATPTFTGCSLSKTASQSIPNGTLTTVTWNNELFDTNSFHDNVTNNSRITIPSGKAGKYLIIANTNWPANTTGYRELRFYKNTNIITYSKCIQPTISEAIMLQLHYIADAAVGDYFEVKVEQTSGGALNVLGGSTFETNIQVEYLGA